MQSFFLGDPRGPYGYIEVTIHPGLCYRYGAEPMQHNSTVLPEGHSPEAACNAGAPSSYSPSTGQDDGSLEDEQ